MSVSGLIDSSTLLTEKAPAGITVRVERPLDRQYPVLIVESRAWASKFKDLKYRPIHRYCALEINVDLPTKLKSHIIDTAIERTVKDMQQTIKRGRYHSWGWAE